MPPGVYTSADEGLLATYAETLADYRDACADLVSQGRYVQGSTGQLVISPAMKLKNELARQLSSLGARLGLDPAARQSLNVEDGQEDTGKFGIH
jgi:P27 family predicted phage terminase small subunit